LFLLIACGDPEPEMPPGAWANVAPAQVEEVVHGEGRSYLRIVEGPHRFWVSVPELDVAPGGYVLLGTGPLTYATRGGGRVFDALTVIEEVAVVDEAVARIAARLPTAEGGVDVAGVYADRAEGRPIRLRGRVAEASFDIDRTNWYHLKDGTEGAGEHTDALAFTSPQRLEVGDVVVVEGPLTVDLDLGFGYFYPAILLNPAVVIE
jgi:hypothetical protein